MRAPGGAIRIAAAAAAFCFAAARAGEGAPAELEEEQFFRPYGWVQPEFSNGHVSIGRVKCVHPVMNVDYGLGCGFGEWGYAVASVWTQTDLSKHYRHQRRMLVQEADPKVAYGYCWDFAKGWALVSEWGAQWNFMTGYYGDANKSYDEWQFTETLRTPYATAFVQMRNFYLPVTKGSVRVGLYRSFEIFENFSLDPMVWMDGGAHRWNRQRYGYADPESIGGGLAAVSVRLFATYRFSEKVAAFGGVTQYCLFDGDAREEIYGNPSREAKADYTWVTAGMRFDF